MRPPQRGFVQVGMAAGIRKPVPDKDLPMLARFEVAIRSQL